MWKNLLRKKIWLLCCGCASRNHNTTTRFFFLKGFSTFRIMNSFHNLNYCCPCSWVALIKHNSLLYIWWTPDFIWYSLVIKIKSVLKIFQDAFFCSSTWIRTGNLAVNSRPLCRWAIEDQLIKLYALLLFCQATWIFFQRFELWEGLFVVVLFLGEAQKQHNNFSLFSQYAFPYLELLDFFITLWAFKWNEKIQTGWILDKRHTTLKFILWDL